MNTDPVEDGEALQFVGGTETLMGDLRDAILDRLKAMPKPWTTLSEADQREMIQGIEMVARTLVRSAVRLVAANGRPTLEGVLSQCTVKDGIKATVILSRHDPLRESLLNAVNEQILIVVADAEAYMGEKAPANPDPDQRAMVDPDGVVTTFRGN